MDSVDAIRQELQENRHLRKKEVEQRQLAATVASRAIDLLLSEYQEILDDEAFDKAINLLENSFKAEIFLKLEGTRRDRWLNRSIGL